jgi:hypothetical protein
MEKIMKILINTQYSGIDLSLPALQRYTELSGTEYVHFSYVDKIGNHIKHYEYCDEPFYDHTPIVLKNPNDPEDWASYNFSDISRNDLNLIQVFLEFGENISDESLYKHLKIIEIPDDSKWSIQSNDWCGENLIVKTIKIDREMVVQKYKERYNCNDETINIVLNTLDVLKNDPDVVEIVEEYYE